MLLSQTEILGIKITTSPKSDLLAFIVNHLKQQSESKSIKIYTPNPEQIVYAHEHPEFKELLNSADINLPDGVGIGWAANQIAADSSQLTALHRIPGIEFMEDMVKLAAQNEWPIACIGGRGGVVGKAFKNLQKKYTNLQGFAQDGPEIEMEQNELKIQNPDNYLQKLVEIIRERKTKLVFVALGVPKQEFFIEQLSSLRALRSNLNKEIATSSRKDRTSRNDNRPMVFMSVGGSFDIISGRIPRAPSIIQQMKLEWLWRLIQEPWRLGRQLNLIKFVYLVFRERFMLK